MRDDMPEGPPIIPYATPNKKGIDPIVWWFTAGFALFIVGLIALFAIEPERAIDPPASPVAEAIVGTVLIIAHVILFGSAIWWIIRKFRRRGRVG